VPGMRAKRLIQYRGGWQRERDYSCLTAQGRFSERLAATDRRPSPMPKTNLKSRRKKPRKRVLALPELEPAKSAS
jgi:hypothetical protein